MSAAAPSPNPTNLLLLAAIGIGAYYVMTRRAYAQPVYAGQQQQSGRNNAAALLAAGVGALGKLFGGSGSSTPLLGTYDGRSQTPWDVTPQGSDGPRYNNPSAYVADDGLAYNPANYAPWDSMQLPYGTM